MNARTKKGHFCPVDKSGLSIKEDEVEQGQGLVGYMVIRDDYHTSSLAAG